MEIKSKPKQILSDNAKTITEVLRGRKLNIQSCVDIGPGMN